LSLKAIGIAEILLADTVPAKAAMPQAARQIGGCV
jgi:hypothetical protein